MKVALAPPAGCMLYTAVCISMRRCNSICCGGAAHTVSKLPLRCLGTTTISSQKMEAVVEQRLKVKEVGGEVEDVGGLKLEEGEEGGRQRRGAKGRKSSRKGSRFGRRAWC